MGVQGNWGITRDADGSLAILWEWPWYWRYPGGVAIGAAALALAIAIQGNKPEWMVWGVIGIGLLTALSVMYELGCLAIVAAFVGGLWMAGESFFPDLKFSVPVQMGLIAAFAAYAWYTGKLALTLANAHQKAIDNIWQRLNRIEDSRSFQSDDLYTRLHEVERRLRDMERLSEDPFGPLR